MKDLRHERRHLGHEIYQLPVTAERKHTDQIHHEAANVFVLLGFSGVFPPPLTPRCAIVT